MSLDGQRNCRVAANRPDLEIAGALLVAPADVDDAVRLAVQFGPMPTAPFQFRSIVVASRTDPYMDFDRARVLSSMWEAQFIDLGHAGHINVASGYGAWPEGRLLIDRLLGRRSRPFLISSHPEREKPRAKSKQTARA